MNTTAGRTSETVPGGDARFMGRALSLARRPQGFVEPNPMVGAVIVRDGVILGEGYHRRYGQAHAEINAIADARKKNQDMTGADLYVTLEPCDHHGKTPPCSEAVIRAGLGRVFCAMIDPNPVVAGRGVARLQKAGVEVHVGLLEGQAVAINRPFLKRLKTGLPWVMLKWAQSLDGKIAAAGGDSRWISSEASRKLVHQWRGRVDAVMVGVGTAVADDPQLTARDGKSRRIALRIVVDPTLRLPLTSRLLTPQTPDDPGQAPRVLIAVHQETLTRQQAKANQLKAMGVELFGLETLAASAVSTGKPKLDLSGLMAHLAQAHRVSNVLVEGGGVLHGSLLRQGLADELRVFVCPKVIGDDQARSGIAGLACETMEQARGLTLESTRKLGDDVLLVYQVGVEALR